MLSEKKTLYAMDRGGQGPSTRAGVLVESVKCVHGSMVIPARFSKMDSNCKTLMKMFEERHDTMRIEINHSRVPRRERTTASKIGGYVMPEGKRTPQSPMVWTVLLILRASATAVAPSGPMLLSAVVNRRKCDKVR